MPSNIDVSHPWYFRKELPVLGFALPAKVSDGELAGFLTARDKVIRSIAEPWVVVVDISNLLASSAVQRNMCSSTEPQYAELYKRYLVACAFVIRNSFHRGVVTAMYWLQPPVYPYHLVGSAEEGVRWVTERFAERRSAFGRDQSVPAPNT